MKAFISAHWLTITLPVQPVTHKDSHKDAAISAVNSTAITKYLYDLTIPVLYSDLAKTKKPRNAYKTCSTWHDLINVYVDGYGFNNGTVCIEFTGDAIDTLGMDISTIGKYALSNGGNVCRIDIQCLDTNNYLPYAQILKCCSAQHFKSRVRTRFNRGNRITDLPKIETQPYRKITFGSPKSDNYLVIYDRQQVEELDFPCVNLEMRISNRDDCAALINALAATDCEADYLAGLLRGKIEFLRDQPEVRKDRRDPIAWWSDFLGSVETQKLQRQPKQPSATRASRYTNIAAAKLLKQVDRLDAAQDIETLKRMQAEITDRIRILELPF